MISALAFVNRYIGQTINSAGGIGGECVDLANQWLIEGYGLPHVYHNAVDWSRFPIAGMRWIPNGPTNAPQIGDLVVWGWDVQVGTGLDGHIALCIAADSMHLVSFDQNWEGRYGRLVAHTYRGVLGWLRKT